MVFYTRRLVLARPDIRLVRYRFRLSHNRFGLGLRCGLGLGRRILGRIRPFRLGLRLGFRLRLRLLCHRWLGLRLLGDWRLGLLGHLGLRLVGCLSHQRFGLLRRLGNRRFRLLGSQRFGRVGCRRFGCFVRLRRACADRLVDRFGGRRFDWFVRCGCLALGDVLRDVGAVGAVAVQIGPRLRRLASILHAGLLRGVVVAPDGAWSTLVAYRK
ncbi:MAG TPA: hypothetical protein VH352_11305 [Pseudonocardiaceae bacterium]|nr:hypothetical protein [Pseudonocardiaceae bacterium]